MLLNGESFFASYGGPFAVSHNQELNIDDSHHQEIIIRQLIAERSFTLIFIFSNSWNVFEDM